MKLISCGSDMARGEVGLRTHTLHLGKPNASEQGASAPRTQVSCASLCTQAVGGAFLDHLSGSSDREAVRMAAVTPASPVMP